MTDLISREAAIALLTKRKGDCSPESVQRAVLLAAIEDIANMPSAGSGWRPIETAPKDGTLVILYSPAEEAVCVGVFDHCLWHCAERHQPDNGEFGFDGFEDATPSHWMPLPEFPA